MKDYIKELMKIEPMLPGTLEEFYTSCGKDKKNGPYYRLSFSLKGKNSSIFVQKKDVDLVKKMTEAYKTQRDLPMELGIKLTNLCKEIGFEDAAQVFSDYVRKIEEDLLGIKSNSRQLKECEKSKENWKSKATERRKKLDNKNAKINNLLSSREDWKNKYKQEKIKKEELKDEVNALKKELKKRDLSISEYNKKNS